MARNIRLIPYDESYEDQAYDDQPYDEETTGQYQEDADRPLYMPAYRSALSTTAEGHAPPDDPMPLFLSSDDAMPPQRRFGAGGDKRPPWPRILKAGIFVTSAAAIAFAVVSIENPLSLFTNAKASLIGSLPDQSRAPPQAQPAAPVQLASFAPAPAAAPSDRATAPAARSTPTRDDIALALRAAHQNLAEPVPPPAPVAPVRRLDPDELAALLKRATGLIEIGDIASARLLLERAADAQEAGAALLLAQTYDPAVLGTQDMRSITPDPAMARDWYQKAARFGSQDAKQRLAQMQN